MSNIVSHRARFAMGVAYIGGLGAGVAWLGLAYVHDHIGAPPLSTPAPREPPPEAPEPSRFVATPGWAHMSRPGPRFADCGEERSRTENELGLCVWRPAPGRFVTYRSALTRAVEEEEDFVRCGGVVPVFRGGAQLGYLLLSVRPSSLQARLGLRSGDLVRRVNGIELSSPARALEAYGALEGDWVDVDIVRRGRPVWLTYELR